MIIQSKKYIPKKFYQKNKKENPLNSVPNFQSTKRIIYKYKYNNEKKDYLKKNGNFSSKKTLTKNNTLSRNKNSSFKSVKLNYRNLLTLKKSPVKNNFQNFKYQKKRGSSIKSNFDIKKNESEKKDYYFLKNEKEKNISNKIYYKNENEKNNINNLYFLKNEKVKTDLKKDIKEKLTNIRELRINNNFFKKECEGKNEEFLEKIKFNIKPKIFDKTVKSSLHFIYKNYENSKKKNNSNYFFEINLQKQIQNNFDLLKKSESLKKENQNLEKNLLRKINNYGLIKKNKEVISNIKKENVLKKIEILRKKNQILKNKILEKKNLRNQEIFKIKCDYEKKGRNEMKEKAIILALENCNAKNYQEFDISNKVRFLLKNYNEKKNICKDLKYQKLLDKKETLIKKLSLKKHSFSNFK